MAYLGTPPRSRVLSSADIDPGSISLDDISFTDQPASMNISGNIDKHTMRLADQVVVNGDLDISDNLILSKISDDGNAIILTTDGSTRTIEGAGGSLEASTLTQTPNASLTGMTGELGSAVTGSPNLNLTTGLANASTTFPAGHVLQVKHYEVTETNALTTSYVNYWENAITLKSASSDIFVTCSFNAWIWNSGAMGMKIYRKEGDTVTTSDTAVWTKNTVDGTGPLTMFFNAGSGEISFVQTFSAQDVISGQDVGDILYYALFMRKRNSNNVSVANNYDEDGWMSMDLMEVQK